MIFKNGRNLNLFWQRLLTGSVYEYLQNVAMTLNQGW